MAIIGISGKINSGKDTVGKIIQYLYYLKSEINKNNKLSYETFIKTDRINNLLISYNVPEIHKFADKLKDIVCLLINCTREQLEDSVFKETPLGEEWNKWYNKYLSFPYISNEEYNILHENQKSYFTLVKMTPRLLLQLLGTECGRNIIHPNIWVNALMSEYQKDTPKRQSTELPNWIITDVRFPNEAKAIKDKKGILIKIERPIEIPLEQCILSKEDQVRLLHTSETALDDYKEFNYVIQNDGTIEQLIESVKTILIDLKLIT